ncbi:MULTISPECIES: peptidylprolyl isomerase [unclassified Polaribacter]|jgi:peptidyl-prolyl cis-trans isomerase SurA|uniref:peptidylprolyl isomerase n=1 Tax=unclassified Polaribacter TaxID=196858 RepID=UPI00056523D0|nr:MULTISPECIES: peptidylprolyl isomerase [unclassified Polaribacter]PKV64505.1 periplasmic chaperone for outer membrane proteins SurA [Polaribacter sp. Hel1_33_96]
MQQKTTILKYTKLTVLTVFFGLMSISTFAQKIKIDGVAVVIGKNIVLDSDIEKFKQEVDARSEGKITISDCEMLEKLMQQKLLAHHAIVDSVTVSEAEISGRVDRSVEYFTQQYGSLDKVIKAYGFNDLDDLKKELYTVQKENVLIEKEQQNITEKIDVTPEEVRLYFNGLKKNEELPEFPAEIELAQIVLNAAPTKEENDRIVTKLTEIKKQIEEGASFKMKAIINSDDPGVTQNGGRYEVTKDSPFIKEFKEMAFSLDIGQVSKPFKSDFGYHLMQLHEVKGNMRVASHILMQPDIPDTRLKDTQQRAEQIAKDIREGAITFADAVKKYSEDKETKNNGGVIVNPYSGETKFDLTRMDPALYARVAELKKGELSDVFFDQNRNGEKMFKFIVMKDRTDTHIADLVEDYVKVQDLALRKKREETITKWAKGKIKDTYIKMSEVHSKCSFEKNWKKEISK